ncbi:hypothetical protein OAJ57_00160 [Alphaproteobacteria bacterium]|nr:hypothetical protein [Alphaproteobacteria bacterium]
MTALYWVLLFIVAQRLVELFLARRNTARLIADGGVEHGARHYPIIVALHTGWIGCLFFFIPSEQAAQIGLIIAFFLLQLGRIWVILSLGPRWTTRVIAVPGRPLVYRGPYRWVKHPNYIIVALEILILPLAFGAWKVALLFSLLNAVILFHRVRVEDVALAQTKHIQP